MHTRTSTAGLRHRLAGHRGTKIILAAAGAAALAATIMSGPVGAASRAQGTGSPACDSKWTGTIHFNPPLSTGGTATGEDMGFGFKFSCAGGSPPPAPPPSSGTYDGKGFVTAAGANDCAKWLAAYPGPFHLVHFDSDAPMFGDVAWSPAGIDPSTVIFPTIEIRTGPAGRLIVTVPAPLPAVGHVTGSYPSTANLTLRTNLSFATAQMACNTTGLSSLKIVASNPGGSSTGTF
jgi:hypothetical protein